MKLTAIQHTFYAAALAASAYPTGYAQTTPGRTAPAAPGAMNPMQLPPNIAGAPTNNLIVRAMTDLSVSNAGVADGAAVDLKATLKNKTTNAPLGDQTVEFRIDGKMAAMIKTDPTGLAWV